MSTCACDESAIDRPKGWAAKAKHGVCLILDGREDAARKWPRKFTPAKCEGTELELVPVLECEMQESARVLVAQTARPKEGLDVVIFAPEQRAGAILRDVGARDARDVARDVDELLRSGRGAGKGEWPPGGEELFASTLVTVCAHAKRDFRCELWGGPLVRALADGNDDSGADRGDESEGESVVLRCSHVGE